ncbi:MAG: phosphatidate cytidylyltransferase [Hyphomicrobiaceae bacterium]|nr:phosphatidate cytidylyltransferase [Hyphomicrobiaceae bacterium]
MIEGEDSASGPNGGDGAGGPRLGADFPVRLVSGIVMALVGAGAIAAGPVPFYCLVTVVTVALSWEWSHMVRGTSFDAVAGIHMVAAGLGAVLAALGWPALGVMLVLIGAILAFVLSIGGPSIFSAMGVLYAGLPSIALIWIRSDPELGLLAIGFLVLVVVATDVSAFLAGRSIGGAKLWPAVSPNKTWSGLAGAVAGSAVVAAVYGLLVPVASAPRLAVIGGVLAVVAQAGDLFESGLKRHFHVKDTSNLIPGHGGVMDRVDGLVAAALAVGLAALLVNIYSPAHALLIGP